MSDVVRDKAMAEKIAKKVDALGGRTFYVGGYVRDKILGKENKDIDIEIHGIELAQLQEILSELGKIDERKVGDHFGIFALRGYDVDIALPRAEKAAEGGGHKDFIIDVDPFLGYENAAKRRDFTINALMEDVVTGEVLDYFGGLNDLENGLIRHVDSKTYIEDPLRVFRAAQFAARFNFKIADETIIASSQMSVKKLSRERVSGELNKALLKAEKPSVFFNELRKMGQLHPWFAEVYDLIGVRQDAVHHPEGDVYTHTMMVIDEAAKLRDKASNPEYFMVSALCHDFGKAVTTEYDETKQKWKAWRHHEAGVPLARNFVNRVYNEVNMSKYVSEMTLNHMKPLMMYNEGSQQSRWMRFFDSLSYADDLLLLTEADDKGRAVSRQNDETKAYLREKLNDYRELMSEPEVTGKDLIELGYKPSPKFTEMLEFTHKVHLGGTSKDDAIERMIGMFGMSDKLKAERQNLVTGEDLIALGYKPGPQFKEMLTYLHDNFSEDVPKADVLAHLQEKYQESKYKSDSRVSPRETVDISEDIRADAQKGE